ncbi:MAG: extracellular solute-binding protein [Thermodesulfobacteriota bacterium]|nr:extracellular solute-binding protein [Thermodesulfobacteriota bacterium]
MKYLKLLVGLLVVLAITLGIQTGVFAKTDLEKAAIKEGKVGWYGAWPKPLMDTVAKAFRVHYPEIAVMIFRSGTGVVAAKLSAEKEAGKVLCDVLTVSDLSVYRDFKKKGFLEKYTPEEYQKFDEKLRDPDGYWVTPRSYTVGIWYNVEGLKKAGLDPPTSWRSLTDPKYKKRIVLGSPFYSATSLITVGQFLNVPGWGWDYWKKVLANDPLLIRDTPDIARTVAAGEREIGPCIWAYISMFPLYPKGTVKVVVPEEGLIVVQSSSSLVKGGPNPNAGKLFQKFLMSAELGKIISDEFYYSGRVDVASPPGMPILGELKLLTPDDAWLEENKRDIHKMWTTLSGEKEKK